VLRNSRALTLAWLHGIQATTLRNPDSIKIATQENLAALADHPTDSRPDIAIRLVEGDTIELILIESKVGSKEGPDQLKRYAEQLAAKKDVHRTALVCITSARLCDRAGRASLSSAATKRSRNSDEIQRVIPIPS